MKLLSSSEGNQKRKEEEMKWLRKIAFLKAEYEKEKRNLADFKEAAKEEKKRIIAEIRSSIKNKLINGNSL